MSLTNMNPVFSNSSNVVTMLTNNACTVKHPNFQKKCYSYVLHLTILCNIYNLYSFLSQPILYPNN